MKKRKLKRKREQKKPQRNRSQRKSPPLRKKKRIRKRVPREVKSKNWEKMARSLRSKSLKTSRKLTITYVFLMKLSIRSKHWRQPPCPA